MHLSEKKGLKGSIVFILNERGDSSVRDELSRWAGGSKSEQRAFETFWQCCDEWRERAVMGVSGITQDHLEGTNPRLDEWVLDRKHRAFWHKDGSRIVVLAVLTKQRWRERNAIKNAEALARRYQTDRDEGKINYGKPGGSSHGSE